MAQCFGHSAPVNDSRAPIITRLTQEFEVKWQEVVAALMARLNGRLSAEDRKSIEFASLKGQNQLLHGPISALADDAHADAEGHTLLDARCGSCFAGRREGAP